MPDDLARKREREALRRQKFTPEQVAAASERSRLYYHHRRVSDESFLAKSREAVRRLYKKHRAKRIGAMREKQWRTRLQCLEAYSGGKPFCSCCGEETLEFLTLDHLRSRRDDNGVRVGGNRMGQNLFSWMIRMKFPEGFRVLCYNCNCARGARGYCPHEEQLAEEIERVAS